MKIDRKDELLLLIAVSGEIPQIGLAVQSVPNLMPLRF